MILPASFMGWHNNPTCAECCLAIVQPAADLKGTVTDRTAMNVRRQQLALSAVSPRALRRADDERLGFDVVEEDIEKTLPESGSVTIGNNMIATEGPDVQETLGERDIHETPQDPDFLETLENHDVHKTLGDHDVHERPGDCDVHETPKSLDAYETLENLDAHETPKNPDVHETSKNPDVRETPTNPDVHETPKNSNVHETQM